MPAAESEYLAAVRSGGHTQRTASRTLPCLAQLVEVALNLGLGEATWLMNDLCPARLLAHSGPRWTAGHPLEGTKH